MMLRVYKYGASDKVQLIYISRFIAFDLSLLKENSKNSIENRYSNSFHQDVYNKKSQKEELESG